MTQDSTAVVTSDGAQKPMRWEDSGVSPETVGMARAMVASGYFENVQSVGQAIVKIQMGQALGITPVEALQYLHIFKSGKGDYVRTNIQLGYPLVGQLIQRSGKYRYHVKHSDATRCEIEFYRVSGGGETLIGTSAFTMDKARAAGLITDSKPIWRAYPETMLYARALTTGAKWYCPEVLGGASVSEESYIDGQARVVDGPSIAPVEVDEPPEGYPVPWARFWAETKEMGWDKAMVHKFAQVGPKDGDLKAAMVLAEKGTGKTIPQLVAELLVAIKEEIAAAAGPHTPTADEDAEQASLAQTAPPEERFV